MKIESPSCSQSMVLSVVKALSRSLDSTMITLNRKEIEKIRRAATVKNIPKSLLSTANLISSLFDEIEEEKVPIIISLNDDINWIINSQATSETFFEEMRSTTSKIFFVFLQPENDIKIGQTASSLRDERTKKTVSEPTPPAGGFSNFANFFNNPSSLFSGPNMQQNMQQQQRQEQLQGLLQGQIQQQQNSIQGPEELQKFQQQQLKQQKQDLMSFSPPNSNTYPKSPGTNEPMSNVRFGNSISISVVNGTGKPNSSYCTVI